MDTADKTAEKISSQLPDSEHILEQIRLIQQTNLSTIDPSTSAYQFSSEHPLFGDFKIIYLNFLHHYKTFLAQLVESHTQFINLSKEIEKETKKIQQTSDELYGDFNSAKKYMQDIIDQHTTNKNKYLREKNDEHFYRLGENVRLPEIHADRIAINTIFRHFMKSIQNAQHKSQLKLRQALKYMRNVEKLEVSSKVFLNRVKLFKILTPAITNCFKSLQTLDADFEDEDAMVMFATTIADFYSNDSLEEAVN